MRNTTYNEDILLENNCTALALYSMIFIILTLHETDVYIPERITFICSTGYKYVIYSKRCIYRMSRDRFSSDIHLFHEANIQDFLMRDFLIN